MAWSRQKSISSSSSRNTNANQEVPEYRNNNWKNVGDTFKEMYSIPSSSCESITAISNLNPGLLKPKVVGIIIHKGESRHFTSKKDSNEKYVVDITIRDSVHDFINVSCWGQSQFIDKIVNHFHIGDIVELDNVVVQSKPMDGSHEKFKPFTPGLFFLNLFELKGTINEYRGDNESFYTKLSSVPVKGHNDYYTIFDINAHGSNLQDQFISILAVVKQVSSVRDCITKTGKNIRRLEVKLFDDTDSELSLIMWDDEWINLAVQWTPKEIVIFAADVKASFDSYRKKMVVMTTGRTIITVMPDTREAFLLCRFAKTVDITCPTSSAVADCDVKFDPSTLQCITSRMDIRNIKMFTDQSADEMYCVVFAVISSFNVDDYSVSSVVSYKCGQCNRLVNRGQMACTICSTSTTFLDNKVAQQPIPLYNMLVKLTDHTGTLNNCILLSDVAQKMIGCPADTFESLDYETKSKIKWNYLLERCKITLQICEITSEKRRKLKILSLDLVQSDELFKEMLMLN